MPTHTATFTWPNSHPSTVVITGAFDNWSGNTHYLRKEDNGFSGEIPGLDFGKAYDYKYVVDGTWQIRDDEPKSWDASGNTNNVYHTPSHAPTPVAATPVAAAPVVAAEKPAEPTPVKDAPTAVASALPAGLLASTLPASTASTASIAPSDMAVKDEPLVSTPPASIAPAAEHKSVSSEPTPAQAIVAAAHQDDVKAPVKADVEPSPATTPKPLSKALDPIASITTVDDAKHYLADSDATLAGLAGTAAATAAALLHEAENMIWGHGANPVDKAAQDQTNATKDVAVPVLPVAPTSNYINQDADKAGDGNKAVDPLAVHNLGKPIGFPSTSAVAAPSDAGTAGTDFSVVDNASTTSHPDNFERVPTPSKLADEPAVVVPKPSEEKFEHVQKEEAIAAPVEPIRSPVEPVVPEVKNFSSGPIPGSGESIPPSVPIKDKASAQASTPATSSPLAATDASTTTPKPTGESLTAPLVTAAPVETSETKDHAKDNAVTRSPGYSTPPAIVEPSTTAAVTSPATNGTLEAAAAAVPSTPVAFPPTAESTPVKAVPGSYPSADSAASTPANTPSKLSTKSAKSAADEEKLRKRKSSIFGKIGSMFGKKDKQ